MLTKLVASTVSFRTAAAGIIGSRGIIRHDSWYRSQTKDKGKSINSSVDWRKHMFAKFVTEKEREKRNKS